MLGCLLRSAFVAYAGVLLLWLTLEENSALGPALLGWCGAGLLILRAWHERRLSRFSLAILYGLAAGAGAAVFSAALMFFKTAWHNHPYPDYPPLMMLAMLERLPVWAGAGALLGCAVWLIYRASSSGIVNSPSAPGVQGSTRSTASRLSAP